VGRRVLAGEDTGSKVSQWKRRERGEERRAEEAELGAAAQLGTGGALLFLPTPSFMASADEG